MMIKITMFYTIVLDEARQTSEINNNYIVNIGHF